MDWGAVGSAFGKLFMDVAPQVAGAAARGMLHEAMPGQAASTTFQGMDARTGTGQEAEAARLRTLGRAEREFNRASRGRLNSREAYLVRRDQRAASAASGGLETGGHAVREMNAMTDRALANKKFWGTQVDSLSKGYTPLTINKYETAAKPNMWAQLLSEPVGNAASGGFKTLAGGAVDAFSNDADKKKKTPVASYDEHGGV